MTKKLKKSLSQSFLINDIIGSHIANLGNYDKDTILLEIGCGKGALTQFLYKKQNKSYHIVELDPRWAKYITEEYKNKTENLIVFNKNILDHVITKDESYIIIGNIPYHITFLILEKLFSWYNNMKEIIIMVQEEVAQKITQKSGRSYGPISIISQLLFDITLDIKITPENFTPQPQVFSRVLIFKKKHNTTININEIEEIKKFISYFFHLPRKKIKSQGIPESILMDIPKYILDLRAQEIQSDDFYNLYKIYKARQKK